MQERIPDFVSNMEHYKKKPQMVREYIDSLGIRLSDKPYLNFIRMDQLDTLDGMEGILCWATLDILSGLAAWAFYDNNREDAVATIFASGCSSIVSITVKENREGGQRCFIGLLDPSARPLVPADELSFVIPLCRFKTMVETMDDSALFQHAFSVVKKESRRRQACKIPKVILSHNLITNCCNLSDKEITLFAKRSVRI